MLYVFVIFLFNGQSPLVSGRGIDGTSQLADENFITFYLHT